LKHDKNMQLSTSNMVDDTTEDDLNYC